MGTEKRERQKSARQIKIEEQQAAATRSKRKRSAIRLAVGAVVLIGGLLAYTALVGGDDKDKDKDEESADDSTTTTMPTTTTTAYDPAQASDPATAQEVLGREAPDPAPPPAETAADKVETSTLIEGKGDVAVAAEDTLVVHYTGKIPDGTVFDSSWERGQPTEFPLNGVIPGWSEGLVGAKIGERRHVVIGSDKAYGAQGSQDGAIPPNTPLAFEVDIVDIIKPGG